MRRIGGSIVIGLVAVPAGRAVQRVVVVDVARGTLLGSVETHQREAGGGVVEGGAVPIRRGVAAGAILREVGRLMRRVVGSVVVGLVAAPAGAARQAVVVVHVTLGAQYAGMCAGQREPGSRVVERGAGPVEGRGSVAQGAVLRESGGLVRRVGGPIEVGEMAVDAGCAGQGVVVVDMARGALLAGVETHQREPGTRVVENGATPIGRGVTAGTILREVSRLVRRIVGSVVVGLVTVPAGPARQAVVVAHVALGALQADMRAGQGKPGSCVVERGAGPVEGRGSVAQGAVHRESGGFVRRVGGPIVVGEMAADAVRAGQGVVVVDVARRALLAGVEPHQGEPGSRVVECGATPIGGGVTAGTILREVGRLVRRIVGSVVVGLVTVPACPARQAVVVVRVALGALQTDMRAG